MWIHAAPVTEPVAGILARGQHGPPGWPGAGSTLRARCPRSTRGAPLGGRRLVMNAAYRDISRGLRRGPTWSSLRGEGTRWRGRDAVLPGPGRDGRSPRGSQSPSAFPLLTATRYPEGSFGEEPRPADDRWSMGVTPTLLTDLGTTWGLCGASLWTDGGRPGDKSRVSEGSPLMACADVVHCLWMENSSRAL